MEDDAVNPGEANIHGTQSQRPQCPTPSREPSIVGFYSQVNDKIANFSKQDSAKDHLTTPCATIDNKSEEEILLKQLLIAIERLSTNLESMDKTNSAMLRALINLTKTEPTPSPTLVPNWAYEDTSPKVNNVCMSENMKGKNVFKADDVPLPNDGLKKLKDISTIFISSDEEDRVIKQQDIPRGMFVRGYQHYTNKSKLHPSDASESETEHALGHKPFSNNYRSGLAEQVSLEHLPSLHTIRKLSFAPSEMERANKKSKTENSGLSKRPSLATKGSKGKASVRANKKSKTENSGLSKRPSLATKGSKGKASVRTNGQALPKNVSCKFKPSPKMRLSPTATNVAIYVFQKDLDEGEVVFTVGTNNGTRADFQCLCPGRMVTREIILLMALKITCAQLKNDIQSVWCLPPSFADDVAIGSSTDKLIMFYGRDWMGCYDHLRLVYLPIVDNYGHWFLMVISIRERKIYLMDSCLPDIVLDSRRYNIRKQAIALSAMIPNMYEGLLCKTKDLEFEKYEIEQARGIPNCVNSDTSGLWVAEWMHMQNNFTSNVIGVMEENLVRMELAMRLLLDDINECKKDLIDKAAEYWLHVTASPIH